MLLQKDPDTVLIVNNPSDLPEPSRLDHVEEPFIKSNYYKGRLCWKRNEFMYRKRGQITNQTYLTTERVELTFDMPLAEIVDFMIV
jgi:GTP-binding protein LepA